VPPSATTRTIAEPKAAEFRRSAAGRDPNR
jgi:hypothetical protein